MKRILILTAVLLVLLAHVTSACASMQASSMQASRTPLLSKSGPVDFLVTPIQLFVSVSQAPMTVMGKSITAILHQVLLGHKPMPAKTLKQMRVPRI